MYDGLTDTLRQWPRLDAMFLPINGRDAERFLTGCLGNFTFQEAVDLAGELRSGLAVPAHYDMFAGNQEDPQKPCASSKPKFPESPTGSAPPAPASLPDPDSLNHFAHGIRGRRQGNPLPVGLAVKQRFGELSACFNSPAVVGNHTHGHTARSIHSRTA